MPLFNPGQLINNETNQIPSIESKIIGGVKRSIASFFYPIKNPLQYQKPQLNPQFSIEGFRQNLSAHNETARSDKFDVYISIPRILQGAGSMRELSLQCEVSELPGRDIKTIDFRHYAFIKRVPHYSEYGQASFTFIVTGDMWEKKLFDRWMDYMVPATTGLVSYPINDSGQHNYEVDIAVNQYDTQGQLIYKVNLLDALPTSVNQLSLDWNNDSIHRLQVNFQFRKWTSSATRYNIVSEFSADPSAPTTPSQSVSTDTNTPDPSSADNRVPPGTDSGTTTNFQDQADTFSLTNGGTTTTF